MTFTMKDYYRNLRAGLCPQCGGERDADGFLCLKCLAGNRRRGALISRSKKTQYQQRYRVKNKRNGLCPDCGSPPVPGKVHCQKCLDAAWRLRRGILVNGN